MFERLPESVKKGVVRYLHARDMRRARQMSQSPALWDLTTGPSGNLAWEGADLADLASRFGTPLHVVSRARLVKDYTDFRDAFVRVHPNTQVAYSYKTNPLPAVLEVLHRCGAMAEVISEFELWLALELGMPGSRIVFNGPAKTRGALELAVRNGVRLVNVDNFTELALLEDIASRAGCRQRVGLRVVTSVGWSEQFGVSIADGTARAAMRRLRESASLIPCALHVHLGNGLRDTDIYATATREAIDFAEAMRAEFGVSIEHLDMGGGFGVPTVRPFDEFDHRYAANGLPLVPPQPGEAPPIAEYARRIGALLESRLAGRLPELVLEPGRAVTSSAQLLLLEVIAIKPGDASGLRAIVDGGKNIAMPPAWEYHESFLVDSAAGRAPRRYSIYGPLCHTGDIMFRNRPFPELRVGDVIAVMDTGAYFIPNQMNFSNPRSAVVMLDAGHASLVRARETFDDLIRLDRTEGTLRRETVDAEPLTPR